MVQRHNCCTSGLSQILKNAANYCSLIHSNDWPPFAKYPSLSDWSNPSVSFLSSLLRRLTTHSLNPRYLFNLSIINAGLISPCGGRDLSGHVEMLGNWIEISLCEMLDMEFFPENPFLSISGTPLMSTCSSAHIHCCGSTVADLG